MSQIGQHITFELQNPKALNNFFLRSIVQLVLRTGPNNSWTSFAELKTP